MANTGRYINCPVVGKIHGNHRTLREWILMRLRPREKPETCRISDYNAAYYPSGYKK